MAYIKTLKSNELIRTANGNPLDESDVYPVSSSQAIYRQNPDGTVPSGILHQRLEESLQDHETDARELHRKAEKLAVNLSNDKGGAAVEITGNVNTISLSGSASLETFGDEPSKTITPAEMTVKQLSVIYSSASTSVEGHADGNNWVGSYVIPNVVGTYTARFDCTYNGIAKYATSVTYVNLRKYFGFASSAPSDPTTLDTSDFSNSVNCTVTISASPTGFKHIYLAIPSGMTITRVTQPDALNAPLPVTLLGTITRVIDGVSYDYKLYQSDDLVDSSFSKRLTIS